MQKFLEIFQIVISLLLITVIIMQNRGTGLGGAFGGESSVYRSRRGIEKILYIATIVLAVLFVIFSIINLFLFN